jgi:hypothetical protein
MKVPNYELLTLNPDFSINLNLLLLMVEIL